MTVLPEKLITSLPDTCRGQTRDGPTAHAVDPQSTTQKETGDQKKSLVRR